MSDFTSPSADGEVRASISREIVQLLKQYYGKGPTKAKTYYLDDVVLVLLRGGFTKVEDTLLRDGRGEAVIAQRMAFQEAMHEKFNEVIKSRTGREVVGFMSGSHQQPDLHSELFILEPEAESAFLAGDEAGDGDLSTDFER